MTQDQSCLALGRRLCFYPLGSVASLEYKFQLFFPALQGRRNIQRCLSQTENRNEQSHWKWQMERKLLSSLARSIAQAKKTTLSLIQIQFSHLYISFTIPPPFSSQVCESSMHNAISSFFPHMQHLLLPRPLSSFSLPCSNLYLKWYLCPSFHCPQMSLPVIIVDASQKFA